MSSWSSIGSSWGEEGQDLAEYALLLGLIALFVLGTVSVIGVDLEVVFTAIGSAITF